MTVFLRTDRLVLREFTESDVDNPVELDSDPRVMEFLTGGKATPHGEVEYELRGTERAPRSS